MEYLDNSIHEETSWIEKYCPKKINDIIGNEKAVKSIIDWVNSFESNRNKYMQNKNNKKIKIQVASDNSDNIEDDINSEYDYSYYNKSKAKVYQPKSCLIITGSHGVGKTCIVKTILNTLGYIIQTINFSKIKTNKNIKEIIDNQISNSDILTLIEGKKHSKIVIIIDEVESITSSTGKNCINALLKNNELNWLYPVIFISNNQHNKLLSDIKKNSQEIKIWQPYPSDLLKLFKKIVSNEKINIDGLKNCNYRVAYRIIDHSQKDFRRLILTLNDLKYEYQSKTITMQMVEQYCRLSKNKDEDFDLFKATDFLLQKYNGIEDTIRYYETEKVLLPLMVHQNYIDIINQKGNNSDIKYQLACEISNLLSEGDVIENYIYGDQNWDIHEVHGYYTCTAPSYLLCSNLKVEEPIKLSFPADLNKASIGKINKRNIINADKCFKNKNIHDYIYINLIVRNLIDEGRMNDCVKLFEGYNVKLTNIESLLKVDKIKSSKTNLTSKQRKELSSFLNEE